MTSGERVFRYIINDTQAMINRNTEASVDIEYLIIGKISAERKHYAQLKISYGKLTVLTINYPLRGYEREVDIVSEINYGEGHLFEEGIAVCGVNGLLRLIQSVCEGNPPFEHTMTVSYGDGSTSFPFMKPSDN